MYDVYSCLTPTLFDMHSVNRRQIFWPSAIVTATQMVICTKCTSTEQGQAKQYGHDM